HCGPDRVGTQCHHRRLTLPTAKTVGLPTGIGAKLILTGVIQHRGVLIPTRPEVYDPVLAELERYGIHFREEKVVLDS
ncbi:MAG: saccharopine dehydrogenase C-terminal domain-containing protein, partial [Myxococcota bacterium]